MILYIYTHGYIISTFFEFKFCESFNERAVLLLIIKRENKTSRELYLYYFCNLHHLLLPVYLSVYIPQQMEILSGITKYYDSTAYILIKICTTVQHN